MLQIDDLSPSAGNTIVVGIDGGGGSGKSTLAASLCEQLKGCQVVHTDDFASWDNPLDWWPRLIEQVLGPLTRGEVGRYQRYDWVEHRLAEWHEVDCRVLLLEGVSATRREFREFLAFKIWVECPHEIRLRRGLERDGVEKEELWRKWMLSEDEYVARDAPQTFADLVINGEFGLDLS